jgi:hypothetical protein
VLRGGGGGYHDGRRCNRDAYKRAYWSRRGLGGGYGLVPVSVEFLRAAGAPAYALLCRVADVAADGGGVFKAAFIESALQLQKMSVTLTKGIERMLRAHLSRVAQASGSAYMKGLPVPLAADGRFGMPVGRRPAASTSSVRAGWSCLSSLERARLTCVAGLRRSREYLCS